MKAVIALAVACFAFGGHAAETAPLNLERTIPLPGVKGRFDHFAIDIKGQRLFVAALGNNTLEVIDLASSKRLRSLPGMSKPTGVLYLPALNQVLVANGDNGCVTSFDGTDYKPLHTVTGLDDADNLRVDPGTGFAWLGYGDGALAVLQPGTSQTRGTIALPKHPESFQLEPVGSRIFVNVPDARQIIVVDRDRRAVAANWPMERFQANFPMALDGANRRLFVGCRQPARLVVLDTTGGKHVTDVEISGDTDDLFFDARRKRLYVSCGEGFIDIVNQASPDSYARVARLASAAGARTSFFSPALDRLYLAVPERGSQKAEVRVYQPQ